MYGTNNERKKIKRFLFGRTIKRATPQFLRGFLCHNRQNILQKSRKEEFMAFNNDQLTACQSHLATIRAYGAEYGDPIPAPASEASIAATAEAFRQRIGHPLPDGYQDFLRLSNGIYGDGVTIWPTAVANGFDETIVDANESFRELIHDGYLYLGQRDDSVFVQELSTGRFMAVEMNGLSEWAEFGSSEAMIEFMLARAAGVMAAEGEEV